MGVSNQLRAIANGFRIVSSFPELRDTPIIIGESDPEGCAACGVQTNPENVYRNGTVYSSYTAEQLARTYELADAYHVNLRGAVTWAFEFEDQPYFAGFRDLATNGIDKPVLNVFRMLGRMLGDRVTVESSGALPLDMVRESGVREAADVNALATRSERTLSILIWNYHDDDVAAPPADVELVVDGVGGRSVDVTHERVDATHSNAYEAWKRMGSPQPPTKSQYKDLERAGRLQPLEPSRKVKVQDGRVRLAFTLPRQAVSLVRVTW
jgi:xylan 1,4-beta-xylosidase